MKQVDRSQNLKDGTFVSSAAERSSNTDSWAYRLGASIPRLSSGTAKFSDLVFFLFFTMLGVSVEFVAHHFTNNTLFVILGPTAVLSAYLIVSLSFRGFRLRLDQLGDNCYYMGFLFTLTALSLALYDFQGLDIKIGTIVANFGVALASTILGVLYRVLLSQMREDPVEVEEQSRVELAQASASLKNELYASVRDMNSFRSLMQQSIVESFDDVNEKSKEAILTAANELSIAAKNINEEIAERNALLGERFDRFNDLTQRSVSSLEALVESMEKVRPPNELINDAFDRTVEVIEKVSREAQQIYEITDKQRQQAELRLATTIDSMESVSESLAALTGDRSPLNDVTDNLSKAAETLSTLSGKLAETDETLSGNIEAQKSTLGAYEEISAESIKILKAHNAEVAETLISSRAMLAEVEKNLSEMARALAKSVA